jgi:2-C-methyl-D-erythritol 4-phosphate cytidylyltransferase
VAGWPAVDTLKETDGESRIVSTPPRERIWHAQTPQVFPRDLLVRAYEEALREGIHDTDDAALVERVGGEVVMVPGAPWNIKVTQPEDVRLAELLLSLRES